MSSEDNEKGAIKDEANSSSDSELKEEGAARGAHNGSGGVSTGPGVTRLNEGEMKPPHDSLGDAPSYYTLADASERRSSDDGDERKVAGSTASSSSPVASRTHSDERLGEEKLKTTQRVSNPSFSPILASASDHPSFATSRKAYDSSPAGSSSHLVASRKSGGNEESLEEKTRISGNEESLEEKTRSSRRMAATSIGASAAARLPVMVQREPAVDASYRRSEGTAAGDGSTSEQKMQGKTGVEGPETFQKSSTGLEATTLAANQGDSRPGAFSVGESGAFSVGESPNDTVLEPVERPPLDSYGASIEAELIDPDHENQLFQQRVEKELEAERQKASVAKVVSEDELKACPWRRIACVVGVVAVIFAIVLGVSLKFARPPSDPPAPTPAPTLPPPPQEIIDLITPYSFDNGASLYNSSSPQSAAARWLADNADLKNYTDKRKIQRYSLATLYFSTNGDEWTDKQDWLSDSNECQWRTKAYESENTLLRCDAENFVTLLLMEKMKMVGTIPDEIAFLSDSLFLLKMQDNGLQGELPTTLGRLTRLKDIWLHSNNLTSTIPPLLTRLPILQDLRLYSNAFTGTIPSQMVDMRTLKRLQLHKNNLIGKISGTLIGSLTTLDSLRLSENEFTGTVPTEIGLLTLLTELKLHKNHLIGPIPREIGRLTVLEDIAAHENRLTGNVPTEIGLTALEEIRLAENNITGPIPSEIGLLNLKRLGLGANNLTGTILSTIGLLPMLERLELQSNHLTGSIPSELGMLTLLSDLRLHSNELTGTILPEFGTFTNLKGLNLYNNSFTGTLPPFGDLVKLKDLRASNNFLTGTIPDSIANLTSMEELILSSNALTGTIPSVLDLFANLQKIHLFNNSFMGPYECPTHIVDCFVSCFAPDNASCRVLS